MKQTAHQTASQIKKALFVITLSIVITGHAAKVQICRLEADTIVQTEAN